MFLLIPSQSSNVAELEDKMNHTILLLLTVATGAVVLMAGIVVFRESSKSLPSALRECFAWGAGFFVAMSVQVVLLANLT
jgi:hypothetical protein